MTGPESQEQSADSAAALGRGELPLEAVARLQQLRRTSSWTSDLSVAEFAAVRGVGFEPVGQVMGSTVDQIGFAGGGSCGGYRYTASGMRVRTVGVTGAGSSTGSRWVGFGARVDALYAARRRAVGRLEQECRALGGDGVVGVQLTIGRFAGAQQALEFQVIGTAVRARGRHHPPRPFLTDLSGQEFAMLLRAGWVPCGLVFGVAVGVRHDDYGTRNVTRSWRNGEVPGYTELVHAARGQVRSQIAADVARHGGAGVVARAMTLAIREQECRQFEGARDHIAEATMVGTALTGFRRSAGAGPATLQILRLDQRHDRVIASRLTTARSEFS